MIDRRVYFADWLTRPDNPYFAKAIVNRIWRNYLGRGLVEAEDDLRETNPPSNRELFDALAADFVKSRFDVKHLMRVILNSAAYQRSSKPMKENAGFSLHASKSMRLIVPEMQATSRRLTALATELGGRYDGWAA